MFQAEAAATKISVSTAIVVTSALVKTRGKMAIAASRARIPPARHAVAGRDRPAPVRAPLAVIGLAPPGARTGRSAGT